MKLRDIAKLAGVSLTSVSLVLNGKPGVGREKRERVERLLIQNGYAVRSSGTASDRTVCFLKYSRHGYLVSGNPGFVTQIMDAAEQECRRHGYNLLVTACANFSAPGLSEFLSRPAIQGIILLGTEVENGDLAAFPAVGKPMVVVDNSLPLLPYDTVTMDNRSAIFSAVSHLKKLGHRRFGFLYNSIPSNNDRERREAFQNVLELLGLPFDPGLVFPIFPTMEGAMESTLRLLKSGQRFPSALVANNDSIAIGAMRAFQSQGLKVPQDISISGFDGLPFSALSEPPLTTMSVSCGDMGYWAVRILHERSSGKCRSLCHLRVGTELRPGGSTAPFHPPRNHPSLLQE
ncbi:MAG: LacI family DNA-binding transcriptional regulator [Clostridiales bacterium]|nr:LacI family DNA-binding transcriptional regulator [Clostridiales bacterium]